jgi:hypothetical protein
MSDTGTRHTALSHAHGPACGHRGVKHDGHIDYLQDGHLDHVSRDKVEKHKIEVSKANPSTCTPDHQCGGHEAGHVHGPNCGHEAVPHGDHVDYLVKNHLHHPHQTHCDNHGVLQTVV